MKAKSNLLKTFEKMSKEVTNLDTRYLLGKVPRTEYKHRRKQMKIKFYSLRKIFGV